jgi:hypothetical protein
VWSSVHGQSGHDEFDFVSQHAGQVERRFGFGQPPAQGVEIDRGEDLGG